MNAHQACPRCHRADQTEKVSTIYLVGIERNPSKLNDTAVIAAWLHALPPTQRRQLSQRLSPPSSGRQGPVRPVHPDTVIGLFSLAVPIFLYQILTNQPSALAAVLALLAVFYGLYAWQRKTLIARFEKQRAERKAADEHIRRGIQRWMALYYCARDDSVFEPGSDEIIPADQIRGRLLAR